MDSAPIDPTVVCAWCGIVLRSGGDERSHGICQPCAAHFLAKLLEMRIDASAVRPPQPAGTVR